MASDNLSSIETWAFRPTAFENSWISEAFARDTEALTKALQKSISSTTTNTTTTPSTSYSGGDGDLLAAVISKPETPSYHHHNHLQSASVSSGSEPETVSKRPPRNGAVLPAGATGRVTKRKSRASKRSPTTFITADPENFRQMVQQVTGVRFSGGSVPVGSVVKPEPQRFGGGGLNRVPISCLLPTLDTSAFLLDHHHQQVVVPTSAAAVGAPAVVAEGGGGGSGFDFDGLSCFPTLESWKVM